MTGALVTLKDGPFDGAQVERSNRWQTIQAQGGDVPEGYVAIYRPTRDPVVQVYAGLSKVLAQISMPGAAA